AGGRGTRLRPITYSIPKPLVPVAGKPVIAYILDSFYKANVKDIIITTGYKFESLIRGVLENKNYDQNVLFSVEKEAAGTAGSVKLAEKFLNDTFIVGSGDILIDFDVRKMLEEHKKTGSLITVALTHVDDPSQFGIAEMDDSNRIIKFLEKPSKNETFSDTVNAGVYIIEPEILDYIPRGKVFDFAKDLFPKLMNEGIVLNGYIIEGTWLDAGRPKDLIKANQIMTEKYGNPLSDRVKGNFIIKSQIPETTKIKAPVYIGENVKIGKDTTIDRSTIYDNVVIGDNVEIADSVLMPSSKISRTSKIEGSVIMQSTSIGENCEIYNSVLSQKLNVQNGSRIFDVALSSEIADEDNQ
ncbi:MAG: sugar phosphate nucleotidyltransferase, partial [Thermoplasmata archaeon]